MGMKGKSSGGTIAATLVVAVIAIVGIGSWMGWINIPVGQVTTPGTTTTTVVGSGGSFATSVSTNGYDPISAVKTNVNAEVWANSENGPVNVVGETQANAALTSMGTSYANTFDGFILAGNDNFESTTDRGTEYYYTKKDVSWKNHPGLITFPDIQTFAEGTPTWSGYDDGSPESTTNFTIGSGATYTLGELRFEVSSDAVLGNPQIARPLAMCANESSSGLFKSIRPTNFDSIIPAPGFLAQYNYLPDCYVLPIEALQEGVSGKLTSYRFPITIEANAGKNPANGDFSDVILVDATWYKDDNQKPQQGWEDASAYAADADIGMDSINNGKRIHYA